MQVITNSQMRELIPAHMLTARERREFDYIDWDAVEVGDAFGTFFRYKGQAYDTADFQVDYGITRGAGLPAHLSKWDGYMSDSFFSAIVIRYDAECENVIVGTVIS